MSSKIKVGDTVQVLGYDYQPFFQAKVLKIVKDENGRPAYILDDRAQFPQFAHMDPTPYSNLKVRHVPGF